MADRPTPRKKQQYDELKKDLMQKLDIKNAMSVPQLSKIVINIGAGKAKEDSSLIEQLVDDVANISGQKPVVTKTKKAVANFKIRENLPIGVKVTLRGNQMWEFYDKLVSIVLPRVKDFRGVSPKAFDGRGNYAIGLQDQSVFPEIDTTKAMKYHPLQVIICTTAQSNEAGHELLAALGMPFQKSTKLIKKD
jgi:large subunit ribosomal protein L5